MLSIQNHNRNLIFLTYLSLLIFIKPLKAKVECRNGTIYQNNCLIEDLNRIQADVSTVCVNKSKVFSFRIFPIKRSSLDQQIDFLGCSKLTVVYLNNFNSISLRLKPFLHKRIWSVYFYNSDFRFVINENATNVTQENLFNNGFREINFSNMVKYYKNISIYTVTACN